MTLTENSFCQKGYDLPFILKKKTNQFEQKKQVELIKFFKNYCQMAKLSGEIIFKVKYTDLGVPINGFTSAIIHHECAKQVYANAPWNTIGDQKKSNITVEILKT